MMSKVLIVEDETILSEAYQMILESGGHEVGTAYDGYEALQKAEDFKPEVILLDLRMPKAGGLDFLRDYQQATMHPNVAILVFSNLDTQKEIDTAYKLGATRYILKAWASPKELLRIIDYTLTSRLQTSTSNVRV